MNGLACVMVPWHPKLGTPPEAAKETAAVASKYRGYNLRTLIAPKKKPKRDAPVKLDAAEVLTLRSLVLPKFGASC